MYVCRPQFRAGGSTSHKGPAENRARRHAAGGTRYDITLMHSQTKIFPLRNKTMGPFLYKAVRELPELIDFTVKSYSTPSSLQKTFSLQYFCFDIFKAPMRI